MTPYGAEDDTRELHVKCTLDGEPARILRELKRRGIVSTMKDAVMQGLIALNEDVTERDLREAQARMSLRVNAAQES